MPLYFFVPGHVAYRWEAEEVPPLLICVSSMRFSFPETYHLYFPSAISQNPHTEWAGGVGKEPNFCDRPDTIPTDPCRARGWTRHQRRYGEGPKPGHDPFHPA